MSQSPSDEVVGFGGAVVPAIASSTLRSAVEFRGYEMLAEQISVGTVWDVQFDDSAYICRYFRVRDADLHNDRDYLISPLAVTQPDWERRLLPTVLTTQHLRSWSSIEPERTVSRKTETALAEHFNWPEYWTNSPLQDPSSSGILRGASIETQSSDSSPRLCGLAAWIGFRVENNENVIGYLDDVIVDTETWALRYLVIDTDETLAVGRSLISLNWVTDISWDEFRVRIDLPTESILTAPLFTTPLSLSRNFENQLFDHYRRPKYW